MFLAIYNFWHKKHPTNSRESSKTSGQASSIEIPLVDLEEAETKILQRAKKDGNAEEQDIEVLTPQPVNPTTQSSDNAEVPPPTKKICHAEIALNRTVSTLTADANKPKDILYMNIISNPEETRELVKEKKEDIKKAVKKKNTLIWNRINQKAAHNRKKEKEK